jgi:hypothetical protein
MIASSPSSSSVRLRASASAVRPRTIGEPGVPSNVGRVTAAPCARCSSSRRRYTSAGRGCSTSTTIAVAVSRGTAAAPARTELAMPSLQRGSMMGSTSLRATSGMMRSASAPSTTSITSTPAAWSCATWNSTSVSPPSQRSSAAGSCAASRGPAASRIAAVIISPPAAARRAAR